ncbi:hypothetical protein P3102_20765 [Amycolatopsis sp. QT-25]|uniref:hypothetical protein n=1 Tax=Amycolatopsis sp. QT-25 TaxID=3034022 RepID=UPI0023EA91B6|nr:hypothetical protein [Amycolatopsis sp. QT-25]WET76558.1 hypothetical protein P3102_20765 [Amycolatopsis sp. QT-25]
MVEHSSCDRGKDRAKGFIPGGISAAEAVDPGASALAEGLGISQSAARKRLEWQEHAHRALAALPESLNPAGTWFDAASGMLTVAVTSEIDAATARASGAEAVVVARDASALAALRDRVRAMVTPEVAFTTLRIDQRANEVTVNRTRMNTATRRFIEVVSTIDGVRGEQFGREPRQQSGEVRPGNPWWPQGEWNCSVGFPATDSSGGKHFLTTGHCTNDANQPTYGQSGNQNRIGTWNVGGTRTVKGGEGDMGVVAVTESGWTVSPSVNTSAERSPVIELPAIDLRRLLAEAEYDLAGFLALVADWATQNLPRHAAPVAAALARALDLPTPIEPSARNPEAPAGTP